MCKSEPCIVLQVLLLLSPCRVLEEDATSLGNLLRSVLVEVVLVLQS